MSQFIIQARMSSSRLPGKVLMPIGDLPMLGLLHRRISRAKLISRIVVVTSSDVSDDPIEAWANSEKVELFRGELNDVASRFNVLAGSGVTKSFVRISANGPFVDPELIDEAIVLLKDPEATMVSSVSPRTTPQGMDVEVLRCANFCQEYPKFSTPDELEQVTKYFYDRSDSFKIISIKPKYTFTPGLSLRVDTPEELARCSQIASELGERVLDASSEEIVRVAERIDMKR